MTQTVRENLLEAALELATEVLTAACKEIRDALKEGGLGTIGLEHSRALLGLAIRQLLPILSAGTLRRRIELIREWVQMPSLLRKDDLN